jgi:hypothetical protein
MSIRTTVTLDGDVLERLKEESRARSVPFRQALDDILRIGLVAAHTKPDRKSFGVEPIDLGFRPGLDYDDIEALLELGEGPVSRRPSGYRKQRHQSPLVPAAGRREQAFRIIRSWLSLRGVVIVEPGVRHAELLEQVVTKGRAIGPLVSDAVLAALAIEQALSPLPTATSSLLTTRNSK